MKKLIFAFALLCCIQGNAQTSQSTVADRKVGRIEGEIGGGFSFGADKLNFDKNKEEFVPVPQQQISFSKNLYQQNYGY